MLVQLLANQDFGWVIDDVSVVEVVVCLGSEINRVDGTGWRLLLAEFSRPYRIAQPAHPVVTRKPAGVCLHGQCFQMARRPCRPARSSPALSALLAFPAVILHGYR
jgi:hypothetical protein